MSNEIVTIIPQRIIPFDIGFHISSKHISIIKDFAERNNWKYAENCYIFGGCSKLKINITPTLKLYVYDDGIGIFTFEDEHICYDNIECLNSKELLNDRRIKHKLILNHEFDFSYLVDEIIDFLRSLEQKKVRITSKNTWEFSGLSYVMSFYFVDTNVESIQNPHMLSWMEDMLYTDRHTYSSPINEAYKQKNTENALDNIDVLSSVHVCDSWANLLIIGKLSSDERQYYTNLEIALQHIWMYTYVTEQVLDGLLQASDKKISSSQLSEFYKILNDMSLIVKKYDSIIDSTIHEREFKLFRHLQESSKLNVMFKTIETKSDILEKKLTWEIDQKRLRSDRNTEVFITVLAVLEVLSGFGISANEIFTLKYLSILIVLIIIAILYRYRD